MVEFPFFYAPDRAAWRQWLEENHEIATGVWFVFYKKGTGQPTVAYAEAVEEALCFGWIDSKPAKMDEERHALKFTPRNPKSGWSKLNKTRVEHLLSADLIAPAGLRMIELAKQNGAWTLLDAAEALTIPDDLAAALDALPPARQHFEAFSTTVRKGILWWIDSARRPETRAKRIEETATLAAQNIKANQYRPS